jgi:acetolactate synthase I/II/III large subunit
VRQWQQMFYKQNYSGTNLKASDGSGYRPDFVKLAEAYGALGLRASTVEEVAPTFEKLLASKTVTIAEFLVEPEENVFPMIPAGASVQQMMDGMA